MNSALHHSSINRAFTRQAEHYDANDAANPILVHWRQQVYQHVNRFLKPNSSILEINSGTGIDALHFVRQGHTVHATDLSDGMVKQVQEKIDRYALHKTFSCQQCSFEQLDRVEKRNFDHIFSNFGGLNCVDDLSKVTRHFPSLLKPGGHATLVIMPPVCPWEWMWLFRGHGKKAFRRLNQNGVKAHVEGEHFMTYYHSVGNIKKAMDRKFMLLTVKSLGIISPPPSKQEFAIKHPRLFKSLFSLDHALGGVFPFNRSGDHIMITFRYLGD